jgi:putative glutamine amidotransferase
VTRLPTIGITVSLDSGGRIRPGAEYLYVSRAYARAVRAAGATPLLEPPEANAADAARVCDGFVLTGGAMLPASFAGGVAAPSHVGARENAERIAWDRELIDRALASRRPLLGVCYGMQLLNLHAGGTLHPDLVDAVANPLDHGGNGRSCEHGIETREGSSLRALLGANARVASSHRQAVDRIAAGFQVTAPAGDGIIEAIEPGDLRQALLDLDGIWAELFPGERARVLGLLIERITFDATEGQVEITFRSGGPAALWEGQGGDA